MMQERKKRKREMEKENQSKFSVLVKRVKSEVW